jgi:hypothetical protein
VKLDPGVGGGVGSTDKVKSLGGVGGGHDVELAVNSKNSTN